MKSKVLGPLIRYYFADLKLGYTNSVERMTSAVEMSLEQSPWFYRLPISIYLGCLNWAAIFFFLKPFTGLSLEKQQTYLKKIACHFPMFEGIEKLVRTLSLLSAFDDGSDSQSNP